MSKKEMTIDQSEMIEAVQAYFNSIYRDGKAPTVSRVEAKYTGEFKITYDKPGTPRPAEGDDVEMAA